MADHITNLFGEKVLLPEENESEFVSAKVAQNPFNIFAFTNAIAARDKKDAWVLYQKALASGMAAEEIFWKVVWQVKTLLIAKRTKNVSETEMKEYPYNKAKSALRNFKDGELENISTTLVAGYHRARRGEEEIETLVEKILLKL